MSWSKTHTACSNCQSDERKHAGHGLCTICYRITQKLKMVRKWNLNDRASLKSYPFINEREIDPRIFNRLKPNVIEHLQNRLAYLKIRGEKLNGFVDGLDLEYGFGHLSRLAGSKNHGLFHGLCSWFEMTFEPEQRRALLSIIDKIEKDVDRDSPFYLLL